VVTSLLESEVGRAGALHFAASLGRADHAHGVSTGVSLAPRAEGEGWLDRGMLAVERANITEHWVRAAGLDLETVAMIEEAA
jgi:hypothetical protein